VALHVVAVSPLQVGWLGAQMPSLHLAVATSQYWDAPQIFSSLDDSPSFAQVRMVLPEQKSACGAHSWSWQAPCTQVCFSAHGTSCAK
jgi:hypothetical protein